MSGYVLDVGDGGAERLRLLARVKWPTTEALLRRVGLREGMRCLDVGCGIGMVTMELAKWVGPTGQAVGVDADRPFLDVARREADRFGVPVEFRQMNAAALGFEAVFDLAYARFLLTHLPDPLAALGRIRSALVSDGLLVVEDIDFRGQFCHPPCRAFDRYTELYSDAVRRRGGDPDIGPRLPGLLREAGFAGVEFDVILPTFGGGDGKRVGPVTLAQIKNSLVALGLATAAEVDSLVAELDEFAGRPETIMSLPRIFQVWGRKGTAT